MMEEMHRVPPLLLAEPARSEEISLKAPELLRITAERKSFYGGCQKWYSTWRKRISGCGPTTAANLLWYLAASRPESCGALVPERRQEKERMLPWMEEVWRFVTPGIGGLYRMTKLAEGACRLGRGKGVALKARLLKIPANPRRRPEKEEVLSFLRSALAEDLPVAFLNLCSGRVDALESWHWVTVVAIDSGLEAEIYDQSRRRMANLGEWLTSTKKGGGFVVLEPEGEEK